MNRTTSLTLLTLASVASVLTLSRPGSGAVVPLAVSLKGVSKTTDGRAFPYTATGTGNLNPADGTATFTVRASNGLTFTGTGTGYLGSKNTFIQVSLESAGIQGSMVVDGKVNTRTNKFTGKFYSLIPNRLGPPPGGSVFTSGTMTISLVP